MTKIADARLMLTGGNYTVWASGPLSTTIILADHSQGILCGGKAGSKYDLGFDNYCPFRPEFIATFWLSTHQVEVRYVGELANTEQQEDLLVDSMVLTIGNTSPSTVYTRTTPLNMLAASRWTKQYWLGGIPSPISINPNIGYLSATKFLPNYDTSKVIPQSALTANAFVWKSGNKDLYDDAGEMKK